MAIDAYRKTLADRKVQNMIHLRGKAELMTVTKITLARAEGRVEGLAEGEARGHLEEKYEMVRKLAALGEDISKIAIVIGGSEDEIKVLLGAEKNQ
ncbi:MAG: hypothetical protein AB9903_07600 [Vulcanimicrobiota bacterium]